MSPVLGLRADLHQHQVQTISPRLQQAVRLLQLSSLEFAEEIELTVERNPFLERVDEGERMDGKGPSVCAISEWPSDSGTGVGESARAEHSAMDERWMPSGQSERESEGEADGLGWGLSSGGARAHRGDLDGVDRMSQDSTLVEQLSAQIQWQDLPRRDRLLALAIVNSLDDDGYLREPLEGLVESMGDLEPATEAAEWRIALKRVQFLEPAGVGARSVQECLRLQLASIECPHQRALASCIVGEHLQALAARDVAGLARATGRSLSEVQAACERIRRLDPRPGWRCGASHARYITPDVIVRKQRGHWCANLNPAIVPRVRLNQVYADLFEQERRAARHAEMATHLKEARWMVRTVGLRFTTIVTVAQAILDRQPHFLEFGEVAMKPLGLREIARELGMHESTVSRVTNNKFMATPSGVFELKHFFSRPMTATSGSTFSGTAIRGLIKEMIANESPAAPLSDAEICRQLTRQGLCVARRTVTKYRQALHIESVERRRVVR